MSSSLPERAGHTLGFRLALWYFVLFAASALLLVSLTYVLLAASLERRDREIISSTLVEYAAQYEIGGLRALDRRIASDRAAGSYEQLVVRVIGRGSEALFLSMPADWSEFDLDALSSPELSGRQAWASLPSGRSDAVLEVASVRLRDGTLFQVGKSTESRTALLSRFRRALIMVLVAVAFFGLAGGALLTRSGLQPVDDLIAAVKTTIRTGRTDVRVPARGTGDALDELGSLYNAMLDRIQTLIEAMRGSLDNVAHDLRTPMARLRATAETALQRRDADPGAYREALADCLEESERVLAMLDALMDISEAETGAMRLQIAPVDLGDAVGEAADLYGDLADEKGVALAVEVPGGLTAAVDRHRIRQAVANLIDNAVKYTPAGGRVRIDGGAEGTEVWLRVTDTGIGIPADELPRIWDRLYRGDASRSERGLGLGLSLVRAIVEAHRGRIAVRSEPGRGTELIMHLPAAAPATSPQPDGR
jgi:signal transduction histidine kinase